MNEPIKIQEYEEWSGALSDEDYEFLSAELSRQLTIRREVRDGGTVCVLNPNQYVGLIMLPSGVLLQITPKVPIANLFYMISRAFEFPWPFRDEVAKFQEFQDVLSAIAQIFAELVERRLEMGLYRSYVEEENNLSCVRGRIDFVEDLRKNLVTRHHVYCRYSDFTWDIEENQVVRQVAHLLSGWGLHAQLRLRLSHLDTALAEVRPTALGPSAISRFRYNRFNEDYRQIHQLCRLFLEGSSLSENLGVWDSRTFLLDMNKLFEVFVTELLRTRARGRVRVVAQSALALGEDGKVNMRPDLTIEVDGRPLVVADCKYKQIESDLYNNHDFYQVLAYCIAAAVQHGLLIYPLGAERVDDVVRIRNSEIVIEQNSIDLGLPFPKFIRECERFTETIVERVTLQTAATKVPSQPQYQSINARALV
jgi:5-methylcytosine-specific restriction enzyme subunit McrC